MKNMLPEVQKQMAQIVSMKEAAENGQALAHNVATCPVCSKKYS